MSMQNIQISYLVSPPAEALHHPYGYVLPPLQTDSPQPGRPLPIMQISFDQLVANTPLTMMTAERDYLKARVAQLEHENATLQQTVQDLNFRLNYVPQQEHVRDSQNLRPFNAPTYEPQEITHSYELTSGPVPLDYTFSRRELELAITLLKTERREHYNQVVYHANLAIEANPQNAEAYACKSEVLRLMHQWQECNQAAESALFINSDNVIALINKGTALYHLGKYRNSLVLTDKVLQLHPHNLFALINKIGNFFCLGMFREAADTLTFAVRSYPNDPELLMFQHKLRQVFHPF